MISRIANAHELRSGCIDTVGVGSAGTVESGTLDTFVGISLVAFWADAMTFIAGPRSRDGANGVGRTIRVAVTLD